jgi:hypothetical protein
MNTRLSPTAAADLGVSCGLPLYLAVEVADFVCDGGFADESRVIAAIDVALLDMQEN